MPAIDSSWHRDSRSAAAARTLFDSPNTPVLYEPEGPSQCREAVQALANCFAGAGGTVTDIVANARAAAQVLSGDRLQGLSEIVQNADDAGATKVLFIHTGSELLAVHDGRPLTLRDVHALAAPWLTTKRGDASATGRFGIGLLTLHSLAPVFELHSGGYDLCLGDPTLAPVEPLPSHPEYGPDDTVLRLPLADASLSPDELLKWSDAWDDSALLFLRSVRQVTFATAGAARALRLSSEDLPAAIEVVGGASTTVLRRRSTAPDGRCWLVHLADPRSPDGLRRTHKKTSETTPIGVALPLHDTDRHGSLFAGLPVVSTGLPMSANAQFDPIASRQDFADSEWNAALADLVSDLWIVALIDVFASDAAGAWRLVPLLHLAVPASETPRRAGVVHRLESAVATRARNEIASEILLPLDGDTMSGLAELAVEAVDLTGLISPVEIARLRGVPHALPSAARDPAGQWRTVLAFWRDAGHELPTEVTVADALALAEDEDRTVPATVALVAAGVAAGHQRALNGLRCLVLENGTRIRPPQDELRLLVTDEGGLAAALGVAERLHPSYRERTAAAATVIKWLQDAGALVDTANELSVLELLANAGRTGAVLPRALTDPQVIALRDALEPLGHGEWGRLGAGIGAAVQLDAITYDHRGKTHPTTMSPKGAYLPKSIDREPDSFAVAAATAPALVWIASRYVGVLRSPLGRAGLGAQRFLRLLGAESAPRLGPHPRLRQRYADPRRGLELSASGVLPERDDALRDLQATWSLDDVESPDLDRVLRHIAADRKATRRRQRAAAMLAVLSRAWPALGERAQVPAAHDYNGWVARGSVRAWWLWSAGSIAWLDNAAASPTPPNGLRRRTPATLAVHGDDNAAFLHPAFTAVRSDVLAALGVAGEPETRELLRRLEELRDSSSLGDMTATDAAIAYQALAERSRARREGPGHVTAPKLRQAFSAGNGLILTNLGWRPPAEALRGEPVFGDLRAFVPQAPGTALLWKTLQVRAPDLKDCIDVMRDLSRTPYEATHAQAIALDTLRLMVTLLGAVSPDDRLAGRMRRVPLATSQGWFARRPVYCVEDPSLAAGIGSRLPVWQPGGELSQFRALVGPFQLTDLTAAELPLIEAADSYVDDGATSLLHEAAALLREDLARNDPVTEQAAGATWDLLATLEVRIADSLRVSLESVTGSPDEVRVEARLDPAAAVLYLTDPEHLARPHRGGRAIAGLFPADQRLLSQAWLAAVTAAAEGKEGIRFRLAAEQATANEEVVKHAMEARLAQLQKDAADGAGSRAASPVRTKPGVVRGRQANAHLAAGREGEGTAGGSIQSSDTPVASQRVLVDLGSLELLNPGGELARSTDGLSTEIPKARGGHSRRPDRSDLPVPKTSDTPPQARSTTRDYSDLDKETLGLDLVRWVLASDEQAIVDLRAQHRVGADAVDALGRFYELKVYAGNEPDEIVLEDSEIRRALSTPDFFVVVVSSLEGVQARPRVRVIVNPLGQLRMSERSQIRFAGVRQSHSLVFNLRAKISPDA